MLLMLNVQKENVRWSVKRGHHSVIARSLCGHWGHRSVITSSIMTVITRSWRSWRGHYSKIKPSGFKNLKNSNILNGVQQRRSLRSLRGHRAVIALSFDAIPSFPTTPMHVRCLHPLRKTWSMEETVPQRLHRRGFVMRESSSYYHT